MDTEHDPARPDQHATRPPHPKVEPAIRRPEPHPGLEHEPEHAPGPDMATRTPEAIRAAQVARDRDQEPVLRAARVRGVEWVRPTDLMARHSALVAGRGIDFQAELAQANVSVSLLRKVEQGSRPASPAFIAAVARQFGVNIEDLTGQPYPPQRADSAAHATIGDLRRRIMAFNDEPVTRPTTLEEIATALNRVRQGMRRAQYSDLTAELPDVIHGLHVLAADVPAGHHLEEIYSTLAYAYNRASSFAYRYGYLDLAGLAAERCVWSAERSGDPIWPIAAEYHRALILLYSGAYASGLKVVDRAHSASDQLPSTPDLLAVRGALHLRGSILSARALDGDTADSHLREARSIGEVVTSELAKDYGTQFQMPNVAIHSVAVPVELSDGTTAVARAEQIRLPASVAPSRAGHHWIDVSRAWLLHGDKTRALGTLEQARRIAPELTRNHPQVHETVRVLAHSRRGTDTLSRFARWANVKI